MSNELVIHKNAHPQAGQTVTIADGVTPDPQGDVQPGAQYRIEDWWDRIAGQSWMTCEGNPAAMIYGIRFAMAGLPFDNEVVYGKIGNRGHLVHVSELMTPGSETMTMSNEPDKDQFCDVCGVKGTEAQPTIRIWGDSDEPARYCAVCLDHAPIGGDDQ